MGSAGKKMDQIPGGCCQDNNSLVMRGKNYIYNVDILYNSLRFENTQ